jgi:hypothetical protein
MRDVGTQARGTAGQECDRARREIVVTLAGGKFFGRQ